MTRLGNETIAKIGQDKLPNQKSAPSRFDLSIVIILSAFKASIKVFNFSRKKSQKTQIPFSNSPFRLLDGEKLLSVSLKSSLLGLARPRFAPFLLGDGS